MIETLRNLDSSLFISAAPQCPTGDEYFYLKDLIDEAEFDALFIQFYNNPQCEIYSDDGLNYFSWLHVIEESQKSKNAKLFFGLPASMSAAGSGYVQPGDITSLICFARDLPSWGGVSLWDLGRGAENLVGANRNYIDLVQDALLGIGCPRETGTTSAVPTPTTTPGNGTITTRPPPTTTGPSMTTSTVTTTTVYTVTCPPEKPCPGGSYVTTKVVDLYTTICPVGWKPTITGNPHMPKPTGPAGDDKPHGEKPHGEKPEEDKPHGEKPEGDKPHAEKPEGGKPHVPEDDVPEKPHGDKPEGDRPEGDKPHDDDSYDKTTTIVVPPPTHAVTPSPEGPTETPVTAGASNLAAGLSGLLAIAAIQVFVL
jgi:chitinase